MLSFPLKRLEAVLIRFSLSALEDTSHIEPVTWRAFFLHSLKHLLRSTSFREHVCTVASKPASSSTIACLANHKIIKGDQFFSESTLLGSKNLGLIVLEFQFVMLANHDQNV